MKKSVLNENTLPNLEQWQNFLVRVNRAYHDSDRERYLMERSLMISSTEMQEVYERLRASETRYALAALFPKQEKFPAKITGSTGFIPTIIKMFLRNWKRI